MSDNLKELTVILTIIWWLRDLERYDMVKYNLKMLNDVEVKSSVRLNFK